MKVDAIFKTIVAHCRVVGEKTELESGCGGGKNWHCYAAVDVTCFPQKLQQTHALYIATCLMTGWYPSIINEVRPDFELD